MIRLDELRKAKGLNMTEMAKELGIAYTTYVGYEKGDREPNSETLKLFANHFGVSIDYLVGLSDNKNPATNGDGNEEPDNSITRLIDAVQQLTEQEAEFLLPQVMGIISGRETRKSKSANG